MRPIAAFICVSVLSLAAAAAQSDKSETPGDAEVGVVCQIRDSHNPFGRNAVLAQNGAPFSTALSNYSGDATASVSFNGITCTGHGIWSSDDGQTVTANWVDKVTVTLKSGDEIRGATALEINDSYICTCKPDFLNR